MAETRSRTARSRPSTSYADYSDESDHNKSRSRRHSIGHELVHPLEPALRLRPSGAHPVASQQNRLSHGREHGSPNGHHGRRRRYSSSPTRIRSRSCDGVSQERRKRQHAIEAAIDAGVVEAFRLRDEPGSWIGRKGARVATAALGAASIDTVLVKDPSKHGTAKLAESAIGGLMVNRVWNGPRRELRRPGGR